MGEKRTILLIESSDLNADHWATVRSINWIGQCKPVIDELIRTENRPLTREQMCQLCKGRRYAPIGRINAILKAINVPLGLRAVKEGQRYSEAYQLFRLLTPQALAETTKEVRACAECGFDRLQTEFKFCPICGKKLDGIPQ